MNVRSTVLALGLLAAVASAAAVAVQTLAAQPDPANIVATRIVGQWTLDATLTRRLDPNPREGVPTKLKFEENLNMLAALQAAQPRFVNRQIFSAGIVTVEGTKTYPYILSNDHGNMSLVYFNGPESAVTSSSVVHTVSIAYSAADPKSDVLFLGSENLRQSSLAYVHEGAAAIGATPAAK
jgi:hypothetical protein